MTRLQKATEDLASAHKFTTAFLETIPHERWLEQPSQGITHTAWQVAHMAVAEYGLVHIRVFGADPEDETILTKEFRKRYGKASVPDPDPAYNHSPAEIQSLYEAVKFNTLAGLKALPVQELDNPTQPPAHPMFSTKFGAVDWCVHHTYLHAGQIALLRRLLGMEPLR